MYAGAGYFGWLKIAVVIVIFTLAMASLMWKQIEPFAPGFNKALHRSVSSQDDVDYHNAKLTEARGEYDKAITCTKEQSGASCREQVATQGQVALTKMEYEVSKLEEALPNEHMTAACTPLVHNVMASIDAYNNSEEAVLSATRHNNRAEFDAAAALEATAILNVRKADAALKANQDCGQY